MVQVTNTTKPITDVRGRTVTATQGVSSPVAVFQEMKAPTIAVLLQVSEAVQAGMALSVNASGQVVKASQTFPYVIGVAAEGGLPGNFIDVVTSGEVYVLVKSSTLAGSLLSVSDTPESGSESGIAFSANSGEVVFAITLEPTPASENQVVRAFFTYGTILP